MRIRYGLFNYTCTGHYHIRSALQWFDDRASAYMRACKMNTVDDGIHIVVIRSDHCKGIEKPNEEICVS